jgi:AcrR family transcriptional regulator
VGSKPRIRRTAEEARERILDAAEAQIRERGPDAFRLEALAGELGISHPAILHHFGSRTELVKAVVARTAARLREQIFSALSGDLSEATGATLLDRIFRALGDPGHARMFAWLFLARDDDAAPDVPLGEDAALRDIADAVHRRRIEQCGDDAPPFEDSLFTVLLAALAMFGNAIAGDALRGSAGLAGDRDADRRFVVWLAGLLHRHLDPAT